MPGQRLRFGAFALDEARGTLWRDGQPVAIGQRAWALLRALAAADGQVLTKAQLMDAGWPGAVVEESNLSVQVAALRKLLGHAPDGGEAIATVARVGYRLCLPVMVEASELDARATSATAPGTSIAVLPLANLSGDAGQDYFADGVTEEIIMALLRFRWFRVVGRGGSFAFKDRRVPTQEVAARLGVRYVLEGSVRKAAGRVRIALSLVDAASGTQLWGEHYDFAQQDSFDAQDRIAAQVAGAIEPQLLQHAAAGAVEGRVAADAGQQDLVYRGIGLFHQVRRDSHRQARELFREACRVAPALGQPHYWLARVDAGIVAYGWSDAPQADLAEGVAAAVQAIRADEKDPYAHYAYAIISIYADETGQAMRAARRAIELAPGFALGHLVLGMAGLFGGDATGAVAPLTEGLGLNAFDPQNFVWCTTLAYAHLFSGDAPRALEHAHKALEIRPGWAPAVESALCAARALGDEALAAPWVARLRESKRGEMDPLGPLWKNNPAWSQARDRWVGEVFEQR
jgi:TolB-like protein